MRLGLHILLLALPSRHRCELRTSANYTDRSAVLAHAYSIGGDSGRADSRRRQQSHAQR